MRAHAVMQPLARNTAARKLVKKTSRRVNESETLSNLIQLAIENDGAIIVEDGGTDVGVITRENILRTVIEGTEMS